MAFTARTRQALRSHLDDDWDAVFKVTMDDGTSHAVFASYNGDGDWSQWGADKEILGTNIEVVTAWAKAIFDEEGA